MAQPYVGEIRIFGGNFAPLGWMFCQGQLLPISEYDVLFNLIGTTYGGDGQSTFGLPDLQGRLPLHQGTSVQGDAYVLGQNGGVETVTLSAQQIPIHGHTLSASQGTADQTDAGANLLASSQTVSLYNANTPNQTLSGAALATAGGSQPHENLQPYLCLSFIISLFGVFPSQS